MVQDASSTTSTPQAFIFNGASGNVAGITPIRNTGSTASTTAYFVENTAATAQTFVQGVYPINSPYTAFGTAPGVAATTQIGYYTQLGTTGGSGNDAFVGISTSTGQSIFVTLDANAQTAALRLRDNGSTKWELGNSGNNSDMFTIQSSSGAFAGTQDLQILRSNGAVAINTPLGTTNGQFYDNGTSNFAGHMGFATSSVTAVSACGTNATSTGSDENGTVTIGTGGTTSCTITFASAWNFVPVCMVGDSSSTDAVIVNTIGTSSVAFKFNLSITGGTLWYLCQGNPN